MAKTVPVFRLMALFIICLLVQSDQCRFIPRLLQQADANIDLPSTLYQAAVRGNQKALVQLSEYAAAKKNQHWLSLTAELGVADSYYQLATLQSAQTLRLQYLRLAAYAEHPKSQFELFLTDVNSTQQYFWLKKAAFNQHQPAILALYQWYKLRGSDLLAQPILEKAAKFNGASAYTLARKLWHQGSQQQAVKKFQLASQLGYENAELFLDQIAWFRPQFNLQLNPSQSKPQAIQRKQCVTRLQFVTESIEGAVKSRDLIQQFVDDQRLATLPICINPPLWVERADLSCFANKSGGGRLSCDLLQLSEIVDELDFSHLVVIGESGKANVHNGIMYLDLVDDYAVFVHELAHFAGFVDEYPLTAALAENICSSESAPNLIFIEPDSKSVENPLNNSIQRENYTLVKARTCANHSSQAYKTSSQITFMEYHDYGIIPESYLQIWRELLLNRASQLPAALNFSQFFSEVDAYEKQNMWAKRLADFYRIDGKKIAANKDFSR